MKTIKRDESFGLICVYKKDEQYRYLVVKNVRDHKSFWSFPKGHAEEGEEPVDAALRETREEAGGMINVDAVYKKQSFSEKYFFQHDEVLIKKIVTYYLCEADSQETQVDGREVTEAAWLTEEEVIKQLTYRNTRRMFEKVMVFIKEKGF